MHTTSLLITTLQNSASVQNLQKQNLCDELSLTTIKPTFPHYVEPCQKQSWTYPLRITWMNARSSGKAHFYLS